MQKSYRVREFAPEFTVYEKFTICETHEEISNEPTIAKHS
jgi:hypothetical protein